MKIFIDTEFNGFQGDLISIGMVAEDGQFLYCVRNELHHMEHIDPWVEEHVIPYLGESIHEDHIVLWESDHIIQIKLQSFLSTYDDVEIIADWPEDIQHLCKMMITGPGTMINTPTNIKFTVDRTLNGESQVPHNAIYDALGNLQLYVNRETIRVMREKRKGV